MWKDLNLRTLRELEVSKQYQSKISNRSGALENLNDSEDINKLERTLKGIPNPN
jgi:hypothetical protein